MLQAVGNVIPGLQKPAHCTNNLCARQGCSLWTLFRNLSSWKNKLSPVMDMEHHQENINMVDKIAAVVV